MDSTALLRLLQEAVPSAQLAAGTTRDSQPTIYIDRDNFNNSRVAESNGKPARKLAHYWLFVTQWMGQALAWWGV